MNTTPVSIEVEREGLKLKRKLVLGKLWVKLGSDLVPAQAAAEPVALVCAALMQATLSTLEGECERMPVLWENSHGALIIENTGKGKLGLYGLALSPNEVDSRQTGHWQVDARTFVQAQMAAADQVMRGCIYHEWQGDDVEIMLSLAIAAKQWLDANK